MDESLQIPENKVFEEMGRMHMMLTRIGEVLVEKDKQIKELKGDGES